MSYSFGARGATREAALAAAEAEFKKVVAGQPVHSHEEDEARRAREEAAALIGEAPDGMDFYLSCSGSVGWTGGGSTGQEPRIVSVSISVSAQHVARAQ